MKSLAAPYFRESLDKFLRKETRSDKVQVHLPPSGPKA